MRRGEDEGPVALVADSASVFVEVGVSHADACELGVGEEVGVVADELFADASGVGGAGDVAARVFASGPAGGEAGQRLTSARVADVEEVAVGHRDAPGLGGAGEVGVEDEVSETSGPSERVYWLQEPLRDFSEVGVTRPDDHGACLGRGGVGGW